MKKQLPFFFLFLPVFIFSLFCSTDTIVSQTGFQVVQCQTDEEVIALIDTVLLYNVDSAFKQNISFNGNPISVGFYSGGSFFGFDSPSGIVLSTGKAVSIANANICNSANASANTDGGSDPDLAQMTSLNVYDAVVIEFDIKSTNDTVLFNYVFGSEEYHDYVDTQFNDVLGIFLSGPGIVGPYTNNAVNISTVPETDLPVCIGNINCGRQQAYCEDPPGNGPNCELLYSNTDPDQGSFDLCALDAYTYPLQAIHDIQPEQWYHVKIAIGDVGDHIFDSDILLASEQNDSVPPLFYVAPCETEEDVINVVDTVLLCNVAEVNKANIQFTGDPRAVGYFIHGDFLGLEENTGLIMTTGLSVDAYNANKCNTGANASTNNDGTSSEPDLENIVNGGTIYDVATIEFDFAPSADTAWFNYDFASEEYHELVTGDARDVFGIFISGPGINGNYENNAINLGIVPGTNEPVNSGTINFGEGGVTCTGIPDGCTNCTYMTDNSQESDTAFPFFVYDGYTTVLNARVEIQPTLWYHVKISIADVDVPGYDSGILFAKGTILGDTVITRVNDLPVTDWCNISPNPAGDYLYVKVREKDASLKITSLDGRQVLEQPLNKGNNTVQLFILPPGTYIVTVSSGDKVYREKLVHY